MVRLIPAEIDHLYKVLPRLYRLRLWGVGVSVFVMAVLDLLGTGVLLPVLLLVLNEKVVLENKYLALFYDWVGFDSIQSFMFFICISVLLFSLVRVSLSARLQYKQNLRLFSISSYLSMRLYRYYYSKGYLFIKQNNSHKLINQVNSVADNLIKGYFVSYTQLLCECVVATTIFIGLIIFNIYVFFTSCNDIYSDHFIILSFLPFPNKRVWEEVVFTVPSKRKAFATDLYRFYGYGNE